MPRLVGYIKIALLALLIASTSDILARDMGKLGKVYQIGEEDLIKVMQRRFAKLEESGELAKKHEEGREAAKKYMERPPGTYVPRAQKYKAKIFDPTYTVPEDIKAIDGQVLIKAGTKVNPLDYQPMIKQMCFIDGDDPDQVKWLMKYCKDPAFSLPILVRGNLMDLMREKKVRLYFDQRGWYIQKLKIEAVPTVVRQSGRIFYVEHFPIDESGEVIEQAAGQAAEKDTAMPKEQSHAIH